MDRLNIDFSAPIKVIEKINSEFTRVKIYVQGVGKNRNYSYMSKERIEAALPTLSYVPVVGHLYEKYDGEGKLVGRAMGGHDWDIVECGEGWRVVDLTRPFGVVLNDTFAFEMVEEYGIVVEYLTANAILWTGRYPELNEAMYSENILFNQSMEITDVQSRPFADDSNYTEILDWQYSALCLLGKSDKREENVEPCFLSSQVVLADIKDEYSQMMSELKTQFAFLFEKSEEGGTGTMTIENTEPTTSEEVMTLQAQVEELTAALESAQNELSELREFRAATELAARAEMIQGIADEFADLAEIAEFTEFISAVPDEMDADGIREKCFAIRGKNTKITFAATPIGKGKVKLNINPYALGAEDSAYEPYGGIDHKYIKKIGE